MPSIPRPILTVHGEDVNVEVPGILTIRGSFLSEGLFDLVQVFLFGVEVTDLSDELLESIRFARLLPSAPQSWVDDEEEPGARAIPAEGFMLALAWELAQAHPSNWTDVCEAARGWDSWMFSDILERLPPDWTPEQLLPEED